MFANESPDNSSASEGGSHQHTQFLDLTKNAEDPPESYDSNDRMDSLYGRSTPPAAARTSDNTEFNPDTPGRVVAPGREQTGRWTKDEHDAFLAALKMYGKEWKKVAAKVKTRTVVQTRTHAQKYFQKLQKTMSISGAPVEEVDMGISPRSARNSAAKKRSKLSISPPPTRSINRRSSTTTINAAHVISNMSSGNKASLGRYVAAGSSRALSGSSNIPRHGFSTADSPFVSWMNSTGSSMKIDAPDPSSINGFPEPSPAATGKRKLAEIAAARMLVGVGNEADKDDGDETPTPPMTPPPGFKLKTVPAMPPMSSSSLATPDISKTATSLQIVNPETLGVTGSSGHGDSPVTPWDGDLQALTKDPMELSELNESIAFPVCEAGTAAERSPLHQAVCDGSLEEVQRLLQDTFNQGDGALNRADEGGFLPLHSACCLMISMKDENFKSATKIVSCLLDAGANISKEDAKGNTPLHWAARACDIEVVSLLLSKNASINAQNCDGETPLHFCMRTGSSGIEVMKLLVDNGAKAELANKSSKRALDVTSEGFADESDSLVELFRQAEQNKVKKAIAKEYRKAVRECLPETREARAHLLAQSPQSRSLVLHHPECLEHQPKSESDWEAPDRVRSIMERINPSDETRQAGIYAHEITVSQDFDKANIDLLNRVHSNEYLKFVNSLSKDLEQQLRDSEHADESDSLNRGVVPFTPLVQRTMIKVEEASIKLNANSDTAFSVGSLKAARRAAGAVQHAIDCVLVGMNRNAFCVVRPPGHHAGINGLLEGGESCGFCIFNNVAAGALYAVSDEKLKCNKCAIVDIDVHHGNGTEEIVRKYHDPSKLFFFSIHLYDNDKKRGGRASNFHYKFYPGTGSEDDLSLNIINVPIVPIWKEAPVSVQDVKRHNTRKKGRSSAESVDEYSDTTASMDTSNGTSSAVASPKAQGPPQSGRIAYRQAIQSRLLPSLRAFNPDLIIISSGFDASKGDVGNARHERVGERMGLDLEPEDYAWTTRKILEIADMCCKGRVVSVLEGGYGRTADDDDRNLDRSVFADCAVRHLHAMIDPYNCEQRFSTA